MPPTELASPNLSLSEILSVLRRRWLRVIGTTAVIAALVLGLSLSQKTVRNHVSNIFSKLQVVDRAQAIIRAREAGMGHDSRSS